eukprot:500308_1
MASQDSSSSINKLIVFGWDDTLFPTTKLYDQLNGVDVSVSDDDLTQLNELSCSLYIVLSTFIAKYGARNIRIVTASEKGWIKRSLSIVDKIGRFSDVYNILFGIHEIEMIHPLKRDLPFVSEHQIFGWKCRVIQLLLRDSDLTNDCNSTINTLSSFGESSQYKAAKHAASLCRNVSVHRVQLLHQPSLSDMIDQMKLLLKFIAMSDDNQTSDISIDCSRN